MSDTSNRSRTPALVSIARALRTLADHMGAQDARPRTLISGYGNHLVQITNARANELGVGDGDDHIAYARRLLAPERIGNALVYLDGSTAERSIDDLAAFVDLAASIASTRIAEASDAAELTDALIGSLDLLHSFLIANGLVRDEYLEATSTDWLELFAGGSVPPTGAATPPPAPETYKEIADREPTPTGAANQRDLALAA